MKVFREVRGPVRTPHVRCGKGLAEIIMILGVVMTTLCCGWLFRDGILGLQQTGASNLSHATERPAVYAVAISPDQKHCVSIGLEGELKTFDLKSGTVEDQLQAVYGAARCISFSRNHRHLIVGNWSGQVQIWDFDASEPRTRVIPAHREQVLCCDFHPDGHSFITCSWDGICACWNSVTLKQIWAVENPSGPVGALCYSEDGREVLLGELSGIIRTRNSATGSCLVTEQVGCRTIDPMDERIVAVKYLPHSTDVLVTNVAGAIEVWDMKRLCSRRCFQTDGSKIRSFALSQDGKFAVSGSAEGTVSVWDVGSGACQKTWPAHTAAILDIACSADLSRIATVGWDGQTKFWDYTAP